ncbi:DUF4352 domain-containing protein [Saccharothrix australiensis]|uniref:Uncharacterized protein DUF4352 n=1 Tax=Saccharothrix australiensis TaxID=2072 RepID=A0A495W4Y5_9PSEU|nr:DUF4352 domain-containing protein [Saccharothrix australiensis]RKT56702.1 uncharacterized protein DUF4352 [Saccharothrix australiensis]
MRRAAGLAVVAALAAGCTSAPATVAPAPSSATAYPVPSVTVRPDEKVLHLPTTTDGETAFTLLGLTTGLPSLVGSHAEFEAKGQFVRIRMSVVNTGRSSVSFDARKHLLLDDKRTEYRVDTQAMTIKRQPELLDLGANVRLEFDVYYDLPKDAKPLALRVFGGPTLTSKNETGTEILLTQ